MTAAKEYTIPDLTYAGSKHAGKVMVDRADYYAAMAREAVLQRRLDEACDLLHTASMALAGRLTFKESPRAEIIAFLSQSTEADAND